MIEYNDVASGDGWAACFERAKNAHPTIFIEQIPPPSIFY